MRFSFKCGIWPTQIYTPILPFPSISISQKLVKNIFTTIIFMWSMRMSQPHFETSVKMKLTLPKVGTWSPLGLLKTHILIAGGQSTLH
jgi:hypothetical protein